MNNGSSHPELSFLRVSGVEARAHRDEVEQVYRRSYVEAIKRGEPFDSVETFMSRFDSYASNPQLDLIIAYDETHGIGQTWGWPLTPNTQWWKGLVHESDAKFVTEDGARTFALSEIMVAQNLAGQGIARHLHDRLLGARKEARATLLVEIDNHRARRAYLKWGWRKVNQLRPGWQDAPLYDVLVLPLPLAQQQDNDDLARHEKEGAG